MNFDKLNGLVPAIIQDARSNKVLMLAFMDKAALSKTIETGLVTFYSRSRRSLWVKGESSGTFLKVKAITPDCDRDTLLISADPEGPTCHTGSRSCFDELDSPLDILLELTDVIKSRRDDPKPESYTSQLFLDGLDRIAQKLGEEAIELVIASKNDDEDTFKSEAADLLFHFMTLLAARNLSINDVFAVLSDRRAKSVAT